MKYVCFLLLAMLLSCDVSVPEGRKTGALPAIFPDYAGVTIPPNIAPLNFKLTDAAGRVFVRLRSGGKEVCVRGAKGKVKISPSRWRDLLESSVGGEIEVTVFAKDPGGWLEYDPFLLYVAQAPVDPYIAYRLIEPGYELWNHMGIYQRHVEGFKQTAIMENKMTDNNCMNCHSFCMQRPDKMIFHMRETHPCTIFVNGEEVEKLNTKTDRTISNLVYPSWHPGGRFIAFSVNSTKQAFHMHNRNRVEVFDEASDVVVYDTERHEIVTSPLLFDTARWETFPTFSPDGKTLYFCTAEPRPVAEFEQIRYSLCSIAFDEASRSFGLVVDTLYNADAGRSASFPRVSPDGRYLLYTLSGYGNFSIWHKDADLHLADLRDGSSRAMEKLNSDDVESYHSWSSNSRWVVFSSRRIDGLYTRPHFAYIDENGNTGKPFLLPQKDPDFYHRFMKSYNIPEFITGKVKPQVRAIAKKAKHDPGVDVRFSE